MRWLRWLRWTLIVIAGCAVLAFGLAWWAMRGSLPQLDGSAAAPGLAAAARIERDARGIPVITAASRTDLAYATGYAHGQDRFFQMDLSRRLAAGELAELFGSAALGTDREKRRFGFRAAAGFTRVITLTFDPGLASNGDTESAARSIAAGMAGSEPAGAASACAAGCTACSAAIVGAPPPA